MFLPLSAVQCGYKAGFGKILLSKYKFHFQPSRTMADWQSEKEKYLNMDKEEKRKLLNTTKRPCQNLENIPTWAEYFTKNMQKLPEKIDILGGFQVDTSKNKELANKVSIFKGDITTLQVFL